MNEQPLRERLRSLPVPDAAAAERRARQLILAAHAGRRPPRGRRPRRVAALAGVTAAALALTAVQGAAVGRWVHDALRGSGKPPGGAPAELAALPGGGRLLVATGRDAWIVGQGLTRPVGHTDGLVSWSAFGRYIACACGQTLQAVALNGRVVWSEHFPATVQTPVWSRDGNRIAFGVGGRLYVTTGDGTGPHALRAGARPIRLLGLAAWRPGSRHELAVHDLPGRVSLIDTDTGRQLARVPIGPHAVSLSWSTDGERLLAASASSARLYNASGRLLAVRRPPAGTGVHAAQISPSGHEIAFLLSQRDHRREALLTSLDAPGFDRVLLVGESLGDLLFSPDGRWLLVGWHELDSWMFFTTATNHPMVRQVTHLAAHLGYGEPVVAAWCCAQPPPPAGRSSSAPDQ